MKASLAISLAILPAVMSSATKSAEGEDVTVTWSAPVAGFSGRVVGWQVAGSRFAGVAPAAAKIAEGQAGAPAASLTHSGYSSPDPDGKNALLTVRVTAGVNQLSASEQQELERLGFTIAALPAAAAPGQLDVQLAADPAEESRIRRTLGLPKTVLPGASVPLQVKWRDIPGPTLYAWLGPDPSALRFVLRAVSERRTPVSRKVSIDAAALGTWLTQRQGAATRLLSRRQIGALLDEWFAGGLVKSETRPLAMADAQQEAAQFQRVLDGMTTRDPSGLLALDLVAVRKHDWATTTTFFIEAQIEFAAGPTAGDSFRAHPRLVKDLSGSTTGLEGLLGRR